jgi:hypothetical protein
VTRASNDSTLQRLSISLRLHHARDPIVARPIEDALGIQPVACWSRGDPRVTPRGTALGGTRTQSYWCGDLASDVPAASGDAAVPLRGALVRLMPCRRWLRSFRQSGGRVEVYVWLNDWEVRGLGLPAAVLALLLRLGAELSIEFV